MKKIKIELTNEETGAQELIACSRSPEVDEDSQLKKSEDPSGERRSPVEDQSAPISSAISSESQQQQQQQQQQQMARALPPGAPANYCNICNKELCNKYFMKTHMQKMHGINLDDYPREAANSGGVVCDICQKELCSKYFLKVHKSNTHGITDFTGASAGSQAANAAQAVAAIALTNYSLNNAQKRAALNLALNQHQLNQQSRQAAALMNAAAASAFNPLQMAQAAKAAALHHQQQQRGLINHSPAPNNGQLPFLGQNPLLAAQLQQQQQFNGQPQPQANQIQYFQQQQQQQQQEEVLDTESENSDRDSSASEQVEKSRLAMSSFLSQQQSLQSHLLNAAAVFNPAVMMAMQQHELAANTGNHQLQTTASLNHHQLNNPHRQQAMDLRNQSIGQLLAQQMARDQQANNSNNCNAQFQQTQIYQSSDHLEQLDEDEEEDQDEEEFDEDSDRDSLIDETTVFSSRLPAEAAKAEVEATDLKVSSQTSSQDEPEAAKRATTQHFRSTPTPSIKHQTLNRPNNTTTTTTTTTTLPQTQPQPQPQPDAATSNSARPSNPNSNTNNNNNSRYLRHYTEACPICERRFKSIKWLQSHVMNDHKNEIGNLFNLLVQMLLCTNQGQNGATSLAQPAGDPQAGSLAQLVGGLSGLRAAAMMSDRQQTQQNNNSTTSTANRGDV